MRKPFIILYREQVKQVTEAEKKKLPIKKGLLVTYHNYLKKFGEKNIKKNTLRNS